jgi:hypothetical protein
MTQVTSVTVNLGIFLIILGGLMLTSFTGVSPLDSIRSFSVVMIAFGIWLAVVSAVMPTPATSYAATRTMFLGWAGILTGIGSLWLSTYYPGLFLVVLSVLLIVAGIGALGYAVMKGQAKKAPPPVG